MNVTQAVMARRSVRQFLDRPVDSELLHAILETARHAPSGGNVQPWQVTVLRGESLTRLRTAMQSAMATPQTPEYRIYPADLPDPWRARRGANGEALYGALGIGREDKAGRMMQLARNFDFFGAPVGLFVHMPKFMGPPQWADLGIWLQTVMLLLVEAGLGSCAQEAWSAYPETVKQIAQIPENHVLFCGLAIGWPDPDAPVNSFANARAPLAESARFLD